MKLTLGYSPWSSSKNCHPFDEVFDARVSLLDASVNAVDAIVLWGGTDINPKFYKQGVHPLTYHHENSMRDATEWQWLHEAMEAGVPIIGVCRGAQMICAGVGGTLFQDVSGHGTPHPIVTKDGKVYQSSSAHHQMLNLRNLPADEYELLAWSDKNRSRFYEDITGKVAVPSDFKEPEVVLFPKIKALAVQGHPEWESAQTPFNQWVLQLTKELVNAPVTEPA